ncbi:GNAT family N-acetyltransferase [Paenibacillus sp. RS8]|uniref:GNAT family N-acetyltransferase n=1 Tax=Paenibacillus odorifer TaxID=189426 RepID=A0A1R0Y6T1_9BACL|nr:GNAT family N-acetyltransferase [Paenibacillus odorifer]OMD43070.1 GNAT family N-acetyltransferase [Paenibacillus odorifer]
MIIFEQQEIGLRTLEPGDAGLLMKWLSDPVVLEFYEGRDRPHDLELVSKHFYEDRDEVTRCIVQYREQDIGYLQFYLIDEEEVEEYGYTEFKGKIFGMDQFIGEAEWWNQGIGSQLIKKTVNYLIENKQADKIVMDPQAWNKRALRVYEKSGFVKKKYLEKHEMHEGELRDCWLIEYEE